MLAEPSLELFARRIGEELPGENVVSYSPKSHSLGKKRMDSATNERLSLLDLDWDADQFFAGKETDGAIARLPLIDSELRISDQYWQEVVSLFNTPT